MNEVTAVLIKILEVQEDQCELLTDLIDRQPVRTASQNAPWQDANPHLAKRCTAAATRAGELLTGLIESMVSDLEDIDSEQFDGNFAVAELIDQYGQKLHHLNAMATALNNLGT